MDNEGERRDLRCSHVSLLEQYLHTLKVDLAKLPLSGMVLDFYC
jgi:hypothetical protein